MGRRTKARRPEAPPAQPRRLPAWLLPALLPVMALAAYAPALRGDFLWDDDKYITENRAVQSPDGLGAIWFDIQATPQYYPLTFTTFWIEHQLWGLEPLGFHLVNVLLHGANAVLLWMVLRRLQVPAAWLAAALFALHPINVESVAWITERKNTLSGLFCLLALLAYIRFAALDAPAPAGRQAWNLYAISLALLIAALMSKSVACTMPAVVLVLVAWKRGRAAIGESLRLVPFFVVSAASAWLTAWVERHHVGTQHVDWGLRATEHMVLAGQIGWHYIREMFWPIGLCFVSERWPIGSSPLSFVYPVGIAALLTAAWLLRRRLGGGLLAGLLVFLICLGPALGFVQVYFMRFSWVADHFAYLASMAAMGLVGAGLWLATRRMRIEAARAVAGVLLVALGLLTAWQCRIYRNVETLWQHTIACNPQAWIAHYNLGMALQSRGANADAAKSFEETIRWNPAYSDAHNNLAVVLANVGRNEEAIPHFRRALELDPDNVEAHFNLACVLERVDAWPAAIAEYQEVLKRNPRDAAARRSLDAAQAHVTTTQPR